MDKLDQIVIDQLNASLFTPERLRAILGGLMARQASRSEDHAQRLSALQNKVADCESRLSRLYEAIENGIADASDPTLKDRLAAVKAERDQAKAAKDRAFSSFSPRPETPKRKSAPSLP